MQVISKDQGATYVFGEGFVTTIETKLHVKSEVKLKVEFDWSDVDALRCAAVASKDLLSDFNNTRRAAMERATDAGTVLTHEDAAKEYAVYDAARNVYCIRVKDLWSKTRRAAVAKSPLAAAKDMTAEQVQTLMAQLAELLAAKQQK